ncbi:MAG TPA: formylglycine-generating enzyme family protein [Roseimicrobium sp.]|nr:formylglycine-generating enzyme family protein [Roseimicrobium sp.]
MLKGIVSFQGRVRHALAVMLLLVGIAPTRAADFEEVVAQGISFIRIPAGSFTMGTGDASQAELKKLEHWTRFNEQERPAKTVTLSKGFLIGKFEITQKQWRDIMPNNKTPSAFKGDTLPVDSVSWDEVQVFIREINKKEKSNKYRLPTEAEWEYCARAGGNGTFGLGQAKVAITFENIDGFAWHKENSEKKTQPVGKNKPNAWGVYDMAGNVWEWCQDWHDPAWYAKMPAQDPINKADGNTERVIRGGSWFLDVQHLRPANRSANPPNSKTSYLGFRLVRDL